MWALLVLASAALFASSVHRAGTIAFDHDESLSFAIFTWAPKWRTTANNHVLNTALMRWCSLLFGNSELSLRLPNVLAGGVYLFCGLALVKRAREPMVRLAGFTLFALNLFVGEYFFVARGYGLGLAFEMASLCLLLRAYEERGGGRLAGNACFSVAAAALAVLSNFSFLNYFAPLLLTCGWLLITDGSLRRLRRTHLLPTLVLLAASAAFLVAVLRKLLQLEHDQQLYLGGHNGFVGDTVHSLVRCALAATTPLTVGTVIAGLLVVLFLVVALAGVRQLIASPGDAAIGLLVVLTACAVALPIIEHRLAGIPFPVERTGLYYVPLGAVLCLYSLDALCTTAGHGPRLAGVLFLCAAISVTLGGYFVRYFRPRSACAWWQDGHNPEVLRLIAQDRDRRSTNDRVLLRANWLMEPSLNFYRVTRHYAWLEPVSRDSITRAGTDYIYAYETQIETLLVASDVRLASFPDIHTVLVRVHGSESMEQQPRGKPSK